MDRPTRLPAPATFQSGRTAVTGPYAVPLEPVNGLLHVSASITNPLRKLAREGGGGQAGGGEEEAREGWLCGGLNRTDTGLNWGTPIRVIRPRQWVERSLYLNRKMFSNNRLPLHEHLECLHHAVKFFYTHKKHTRKTDLLQFVSFQFTTQKQQWSGPRCTMNTRPQQCTQYVYRIRKGIISSKNRHKFLLKLFLT